MIHPKRTILMVLACVALAGCLDDAPPTAQGYVEGVFVNLGLSAGGRVVAVALTRGAQAAAGDVAFRLDARVEDVLFRAGEVVAAGQPVVRLLPPGNIVVRAYLGAARSAGATAGLGCDGCGAAATATIAFVSGEATYAPPVLYSREGRDKLTFLVELRPDAATAARLRPGQPVEIRLLRAAP